MSSKTMFYILKRVLLAVLTFGDSEEGGVVV